MPVLQATRNADGGSPDRLFAVQGNLDMRGIYVLGVNDQGTALNQEAIEIRAADVRVTLEDNVFDQARLWLIDITADGLKLYFRDNVVRNQVNDQLNPFNGRLFRGNAANDTIFVQNNTIAQLHGAIYTFNDSFQNHVVFDHNTVYNTGLLSFDAFNIKDYFLSNNVLVNIGAQGDFTTDQNVQSTFQVGPITEGVTDPATGQPLTEGGRRIYLVNNNEYLEEAVQTFIDSKEFTIPLVEFGQNDIEFMNANPNSVVFTGNIAEPLTFDTSPGTDRFLAYAERVVPTDASGSQPGSPIPDYFYDADDDDNPLTITYPGGAGFEDFGYSTSTVSYTAGTPTAGGQGCPLGDLNYFPSLKEACTAAANMFIEDARAVPNEGGPGALAFGVSGSFPNPTTGRVAVRFDLDAPATVTAEVFDALGRRVLATAPTAAAAGAGLSVGLDTSGLPAGLYVVRLTAASGATTEVASTRLTVVR